MKESECVRVHLKDTPQEFIDKYKVEDLVCFSWVYFEVNQGCYGLPQSGKLAHNLLSERLQETGYYETATTRRVAPPTPMSLAACARELTRAPQGPKNNARKERTSTFHVID